MNHRQKLRPVHQVDKKQHFSLGFLDFFFFTTTTILPENHHFLLLITYQMYIVLHCYHVCRSKYRIRCTGTAPDTAQLRHFIGEDGVGVFVSIGLMWHVWRDIVHSFLPLGSHVP